MYSIFTKTFRKITSDCSLIRISWISRSHDFTVIFNRVFTFQN